MEQIKKSLNPCYNGICSLTLQKKARSCNLLIFSNTNNKIINNLKL